MEKRFPFRAEYAKENEGRCHTCGLMFDSDSLKIAKCLPSPVHDGVTYQWHHRDCIFSTPQKPQSISVIANFDNIRWVDQEYLKIKTEGWSEPSTSKVIYETTTEQSQSDDLANYRIEFNDSTNEDQKIVLTKLPTVDNENLPPVAKRTKLDTTVKMDDWVYLMKKQNEKFFDMRDEIKQLDEEDMIKLLTHNNQRYSKNKDELINALADRLAFGSVNACKKCYGKRRFISGYGYVCTGTSEWGMCQDISTDPKRTEFKIPLIYKIKYDFLRSYVPNVEKRVMRMTASANLSIDHQDSENAEQKINPNLLKQKFKYRSGGYFKGIVIDVKTHLQGIAQVYECNGEKYTATLAATNIAEDFNSFYKLQILQYIHEEKFSLLRSWGRIGTNRVGSTFSVMPLSTCIEEFERYFFEKTNNQWENRDQFIKHSYKYHLIDTRDDVDFKTEIKSELEPPIWNLMNLIFNLDHMKNLMVDFSIDVDKMPSSKLSKTQIDKAFYVLLELENLILCNISDKTTLVNASNKFYTLIPHSFGTSAPPILDNLKKIQEKADMLKALLDLEIAYNFISSGTNKEQHLLDAIYEKLKIKTDILDSDNEEYKLIERYAKNTHAPTHSEYTLEIENIFKIERQGEADRYKSFESLHNKKLLWHGSRTTNFAGILSEGLRIAPPEAPSTGWMFGKGIYFSDMVSKSANYCHANRGNPTGLLLLCEVALGNMVEKHQQCPDIELPADKHSAFGRGKTCPNPEEIYKFLDGVEIPYGTPISSSDLSLTDLVLLYNEYIVYNPAQVKCRYLVRMKFIFNN
ncbi:poly [ADP-ribose] polymerase-like [Chelonus insularis]|uniref:poly [ADP-ribose] polymerase-like n=1 Tax=Chelonus insularis TaxID=460826 RepID=UPI00158EB5E3|nr:poly [ADP-ribose] polymerase-like [Chelonus insularis]